MRKTSKGRRRVELNEFCVNCNKLHHQAEIDRLRGINSAENDNLHKVNGLLSDEIMRLQVRIAELKDEVAQLEEDLYDY